MATEIENQEGPEWPLPKFRFVVELGDEIKPVSFQEVSGMDSEYQITEYRSSKTPLLPTEKIHGIAKNANITMKRGVFEKNNTFLNWYSEIKMNTPKKMTVSIKLLDVGDNVTMQWTLNNAWPTKIFVNDLNSEENEVAVESLEIAFESIISSSEKL